MAVSEQDVDRVAELANLEFTSGEKAGMLRDLNSVLDYFAQLNELDTSSVPPMAQVADQLTEGREPEAATPHLRAGRNRSVPEPGAGPCGVPDTTEPSSKYRKSSSASAFLLMVWTG